MGFVLKGRAVLSLQNAALLLECSSSPQQPNPNPALCPAECLPRANPHVVKHHLLLGNNHNFIQICLLEGIPVCQGLTLFPFLFWAEIAKPTVSSLPPFSQPLSRCVSFTDRLIEFDFLWSRGLACSLTCMLLFSLALHPSRP